MKKWALAAAALMFCIPAFAQVAADGPAVAASSSGDTHRAGQDIPIEVDFQAGTFIGGRLKGTVYGSKSFGLAVEGLYGSDLAVFDFSSNSRSSAFGGGLRLDYALSSSSRNALLLSPAVDVYDADSRGAVFIAPNVDLSWLHQFGPHFGIVLGGQGGVQLGMGGHDNDADGNSYSGKSIADIGIYAGARF